MTISSTPPSTTTTTPKYKIDTDNKRALELRLGGAVNLSMECLKKPSPVREGGSRRLTDEVSCKQTNSSSTASGPPSPTGEGVW